MAGLHNIAFLEKNYMLGLHFNNNLEVMNVKFVTTKFCFWRTKDGVVTSNLYRYYSSEDGFALKNIDLGNIEGFFD
ncbi:MAG TPA: hypothetical protein DIW24_01795 [Bacteroidetes bacterium]|nr:hypothetical protein [Bacteroidota bacterium]